MFHRNFASRQWALTLSLLLLAISIGGCGKDPVNNDTSATTGSITVNLIAPAQSNVNGHAARLALLNQAGDSLMVVSEDELFADGFVQITVDSIPADVYALMVAISHDSSATQETGLVSDSDYFWMGLDVEVSGADTLTLSQYHWQRYYSEAIIVGVRGIPSSQEGKIAGAGLFTDGYDVLATSQPNAIVGAASFVYNGAIVVSMFQDGELGPDPLSAGEYDFWCIVDVDGTPEDWFTQNGQGGIENGDLIAQSDFTYLGPEESQFYFRTGDFTALDAQTLTLNLTVPTELGLEGHGLYLYVYETFQDPHLALGETVVEGTDVTVSVELLQAGTFQLLVVLDKDNSFSPNVTEYPCLTVDDYFWGTLDLTVLTDRTITISDSALQNYQSFIYSVKGIPAGNDGKPFAVALYPDGEQPLNIHDDPVFAGVGMVYNNSAMVSLQPTDMLSGDSSGYIPEGDYDAWTLVDVDGHMSDFFGDAIVRPATIGDRYYKFDVTYDEENRYADFQEREGSFLPIIAVTGDIDCPTFHGNNIYIYLFRENPFTSEGVDPVVTLVSPEPGWYEMPYYSNDSMYIVAFWDNDGSGEDGGPSAGDLIGAYGLAQRR
ncbi:MAG: hypothetical protein IPH75_07825 [bacterium]|nr:hypothetical protein [bacterium]